MVKSGEPGCKKLGIFLGLGLLSIGQAEAKAVRFFNVTEVPVYFAVYSVEGAEAIVLSAPQEGFYTAPSVGQQFLQGQKYSSLQSIEFGWPGQKCSFKNLLGMCLEHFPRTVFFAFDSRDILAGHVNMETPRGIGVTYLDKPLEGSLFQGYSVGGDGTYFVFYNPFGFDAVYGASGNQGKDIKAQKINATDANDKNAESLRRYLLFARYQYFGK